MSSAISLTRTNGAPTPNKTCLPVEVWKHPRHASAFRARWRVMRTDARYSLGSCAPGMDRGGKGQISCSRPVCLRRRLQCKLECWNIELRFEYESLRRFGFSACAIPSQFSGRARDINVSYGKRLESILPFSNEMVHIFVLQIIKWLLS